MLFLLLFNHQYFWRISIIYLDFKIFLEFKNLLNNGLRKKNYMLVTNVMEQPEKHFYNFFYKRKRNLCFLDFTSCTMQSMLPISVLKCSSSNIICWFLQCFTCIIRSTLRKFFPLAFETPPLIKLVLFCIWHIFTKTFQYFLVSDVN